MGDEKLEARVSLYINCKIFGGALPGSKDGRDWLNLSRTVINLMEMISMNFSRIFEFFGRDWLNLSRNVINLMEMISMNFAWIFEFLVGGIG